MCNVETKFKEELDALLTKYSATVEIRDNTNVYHSDGLVTYQTVAYIPIEGRKFQYHEVILSSFSTYARWLPCAETTSTTVSRRRRREFDSNIRTKTIYSRTSISILWAPGQVNKKYMQIDPMEFEKFMREFYSPHGITNGLRLGQAFCYHFQVDKMRDHGRFDQLYQLDGACALAEIHSIFEFA